MYENFLNLNLFYFAFFHFCKLMAKLKLFPHGVLRQKNALYTNGSSCPQDESEYPSRRKIESCLEVLLTLLTVPSLCSLIPLKPSLWRCQMKVATSIFTVTSFLPRYYSNLSNLYLSLHKILKVISCIPRSTIFFFVRDSKFVTLQFVLVHQLKDITIFDVYFQFKSLFIILYLISKNTYLIQRNVIFTSSEFND